MLADTLGEFLDRTMSDVLILVLLEYARRLADQLPYYFTTLLVLILVLLEYARRLSLEEWSKVDENGS